MQLCKDKANGVPTASVAEVRGIQQTVEGKGLSDVEISQRKVFLLCENWWDRGSGPLC